MRRGDEEQRWSKAPVSARQGDRAQGGFSAAHHYPHHPLLHHSHDHHQHHQQPLQHPSHRSSSSFVSPVGSDRKPAIGPSRFQTAYNLWNRPPPRKPPEPLRRAVASCLSGSNHPSSEAVRILQDYLSNPTTVDLAYMVLLEQANAERDRSPTVISRCVTFLKRYLVRYIPKQVMLQQIDNFCAALVAECSSLTKVPRASPFLPLVNDPTIARHVGNSFPSSGPLRATKVAFSSGPLVKSLIYVRSLVLRHIPSSVSQSSRVSDVPHGLSKHISSFHAPSGQVPKQDFLGTKGPGRTSTLHLGGVQYDDYNHFIATDVLKWRWMGGKRQQFWTPSPVMTDSGGIARPQVKQLYEFASIGAGSLFLKGVDASEHRQHGKLGENKPSIEKVGQFLQPLEVTTGTVSLKSHLKTIAASKRQKSESQQVWDSHAPKSTWRRRPRPLFQYKYYSEQQPLRLSNAEIEEVISAFCVDGFVVGSSPAGINSLFLGFQPGRSTIETADVAGSVLIKLILDMYMAESQTASPLTVSVLEGMLGSVNVAVRMCAFDLILNLGVHAHLLEPIQMEDQSAIEEPCVETTHVGISAPFTSTRRGLSLEEVFRAEEKLEIPRQHEERVASKHSPAKMESGTPEAVAAFEMWLLQILHEMLLFLVQVGEKEEEVWAAALSCLLYFVCDQGKVQRQRLNGMDIRVVKALLEVSLDYGWANELYNTFVYMMSNLLYNVSVPDESSLGRNVTFDIDKLELLGGVEFFCAECARAKSIEAKNSLFSLLMDYLLHKLAIKHGGMAKSFPEFEEAQAVVCSLLLAGAPEVMSLAFKHGLKNVGEGLSRSIMSAMSRDVDNGRLNSDLLEDITRMLDVLLESYTQPDAEFSELINVTNADEGLYAEQTTSSTKDYSLKSRIMVQSWATLHALLHSPIKTCRIHGYSWLADLLSLQLTSSIKNLDTASLHEDFWLSNHDENRALKLFHGLLKSKLAYVRRGFILVLERLLVRCQEMAMDHSIYLFVGGPTQDTDTKASVEKWATISLNLLNSMMRRIVSVNDTDWMNILQMCNVIFSKLCVILPRSMKGSSTNNYARENMISNNFGVKDVSTSRPFSCFLEVEKMENVHIWNGSESLNILGTPQKSGLCCNSMASMLLNGQAAAPKDLIAAIATDLLYWPLLQLAGAATEDIALGVAVGSKGRGCMPGGASDIRAALLVLLIGKCSIRQSTFEEVGGEEFFRSLLDDMDARVAYYTASFLLKRMMMEEPEKYQRVLHTLVFRAQQSNNEKLLENPYLQMRGILQLSIEEQ